MSTHTAPSAPTYAERIAQAIADRPIEARILRKVYRALNSAGTPITRVWDGEEWAPITGCTEFLNLAFDLDELRAYTAEGSWVFLTMGEEWDVICDYTVDLEDALTPVSDYIERYGN
jgi:hypothetical protein